MITILTEIADNQLSAMQILFLFSDQTLSYGKVSVDQGKSSAECDANKVRLSNKTVGQKIDGRILCGAGYCVRLKEK
jgi:hypothetical protein